MITQIEAPARPTDVPKSEPTKATAPVSSPGASPRRTRRRSRQSRIWTSETTTSRKAFDVLLVGLAVAWIVAFAASGSWVGQHRGWLILATLVIAIPSLFSSRSAPPSAYRDPHARPVPRDPSFFRSTHQHPR